MKRSTILTAAAVLIVLLVGLATSSGCAHMTPYEKDAFVTSVSFGQECVAQPLVECPWTAGADAFKECAVKAALPCGIEKVASLLAIGFAYAWDKVGLFLSAPPVTDTPYPRRVIACTNAIDANAVALRCEKRHPRICVADAVGACLELAAQGDDAAAVNGPMLELEED